MFNEKEKKVVKSEIIFQKALEVDLEDISKLIVGMNKDDPNQFWLRSQKSEYYKWMYYNNPAGKAIVYCAKHNGKIVSTFAMAPKIYNINGQDILCGKTMDIFTDPNYQGMGLMSRLGKTIFEDAKKEEFSFWYVTPSVNSYPIFKNKWGYIENFELVYLVKIIRSGTIVKSILRSQFMGNIAENILNAVQNIGRGMRHKIKDYEVAEISAFDHETTELWEKFRHRYKVSQVRDAKYMNWRYFDNPDKYGVYAFRQNGVIYGLVVIKTTFRKGIQVGELVDFLYDPEHEYSLNTLIDFAISQFLLSGCTLVQNWVFENSTFEKSMKQAGIRFKRKKLKILLSPNSIHEEVYDPQAWFFTQGDGNDI